MAPTWRILRDPPEGAAWNMAVDESLARSGRDDEGVLRIYRWSRPTLSFGRNQPSRQRYDLHAARALGVEVVRRPTGGREVLHDRELTYSVTAPLEVLGGLRAAYRTLNEALVGALRSLGAPARLAAPEGRAPEVDGGPCFEAPAEGEVEVEGRKLVGSAQVRIGNRLLQHGSLLLGPPSVALEALATPPRTEGPTGASSDPRPGPGSRPAFVTLNDVLEGPVSFSRVASAVEAAMAGTLGGRWSRDELRPGERKVASEWLEHYQSPRWTWRR